MITLYTAPTPNGHKASITLEQLGNSYQTVGIDLPRSTIKFYIRSGLLPAGEAQGRNQAAYGPRHLERLELTRALREVADLPLDVITRVAKQLDATLEQGWDADADRRGAARDLGAPEAPARARRTRGAREAPRRAARLRRRPALDDGRRGPRLRRRDRRRAAPGAPLPVPRLPSRDARLLRARGVAALRAGVRQRAGRRPATNSPASASSDTSTSSSSLPRHATNSAIGSPPRAARARRSVAAFAPRCASCTRSGTRTSPTRAR
jgi:DNA-binding transcriptional MerR regulator